MCEIILLWFLGKQLAAKASAKGHAPAPYVIMLVLLWFVGECGGGITGLLATGALDPNKAGNDEINPLAFVFAIGGAALSAIISFSIVAALPDRTRRQSNLGEEDDEFYRRRRGFDDRYEPPPPRDRRDSRPGEDPWDADERFER
jgi:hypothetical protein